MVVDGGGNVGGDGGVYGSGDGSFGIVCCGPTDRSLRQGRRRRGWASAMAAELRRWHPWQQ